MTVPLALAVMALLVATLAPRLLGRARWARESPRLGILAWQASVLAVLACGVLLAFTAAVPVDRISFDVGHILHACPEVLQARYRVLDRSWVQVASLLIATATFLALARALARQGLAVRRGRTRQRQLLDLLVRRHDVVRGAHILEHDVPLAYCVPGGGGHIVVTTAAVAALDERQMTAVLAHEHAHLDGRHDLILFVADVAAAAFPWSRFFRRARRELSLLVEMLADDEASRRSDRTVLATALVDLGQSPAPQGAVAANGDTVERVHRLIHTRSSTTGTRRVVVVSVSMVLLASPWVIAIAPAWAARSGLCPVPAL
ncbi:MAG TPA: M56 family metallopeptidase [Mycobacteriales bacterium]|nr:M56 family metallopeptidase [Mycobacteriales bacterium]